ncbi:NAD(P)H-flavin reductase [Vibrio breoganii]|uniref:NAD(P)H-flavin reductase n=1 Tax=Vibrio breoganii TaxID=553239 RepID=UPI000C8227D9|nr:NAD(P)H-flavin reductase [Vibrio breoganii]PMG95182.1 NAD(P)H-flavin reductase [Vibrio breoganii]PMP03635.1 NAD(P)H-flavin reductase [Vibrio breoganii]TKG25988.1 NAD(P)H-flavin reductase [Vibrio breoganii]
MTIRCKVKSIKPLASNTFRVLLHPETPVEFEAGQYLMVVMGEKDKRPFSIASSPCRHEGELELHIGAAEENAYALEVVNRMHEALSNGSDIVIDAPHGDAALKESDRSMLLIAGGTGFSYVRSILDHCISQNINNPIYLYWGARSKSQLYAFDELTSIEEQYANIHFVPVVEDDEGIWTGKTGNVLQAVMQDFSDLSEYDIYIAGRFEMAGSAREQFIFNKKAKVEQIYSDAFAFI